MRPGGVPVSKVLVSTPHRSCTQRSDRSIRQSLLAASTAKPLMSTPWTPSRGLIDPVGSRWRGRALSARGHGSTPAPPQVDPTPREWGGASQGSCIRHESPGQHPTTRVSDAMTSEVLGSHETGQQSRHGSKGRSPSSANLSNDVQSSVRVFHVKHAKHCTNTIKLCHSGLHLSAHLASLDNRRLQPCFT